MVVAAFLLAVGMIQLSGVVPRDLLIRFPRLFGADAQSSRSMLSTIAGAMATIAGVTFSITVVAVAQASSQYTSRILRNFLNDRPSQFVLGMLAGTFVYCLVLIRTIRGDADLLFIPGLGVLGAFGLAIASIGFLVYFIHHIAESLQASVVLARVRRETIATIDRLYPSSSNDAPADLGAADASWSDTGWQEIAATETGYLQAIDREALISWACETDAVVHMRCKVGDYVIEGTPLLAISGRDPARLAKFVPSPFIIGAYRTIDQDASFGIQQVVDIANKALSPGINDATTAVNAVDTLSAILVRLGSRRIDAGVCVVAGIERFAEPCESYETLVSAAFDQLRRSASHDSGVSVHLLRTLARAVAHTPSHERRRVLQRNADLIREAALSSVVIGAEAVLIDAAHASVFAASDLVAMPGAHS